MADDAPAGAGTDETSAQDSARPGNGEVAEAAGRSDVPAADRTGNGGGPRGGNGASATSDPDRIPGLTTGPLTTGSLTTASLGTSPLASEPLGSEPLGSEPLGSEPLGSEPVAGDPGDSGTLADETLAAGSAAAEAVGAGLPPRVADGTAAGPGASPAAGSTADADAGPAGSAGPDTTSTSTSPIEPSVRPGKTRRRGGRGSFWRELPILIVVAVALAILIRTFLVQAFFIPSGSMEKTLHGCPGCSGDRVLVNKLVYDFRDPRPGDVVVFKGPPSWDAEVPFSEPSNAVGKAMRWVGQTIGVSQPDEKDFVKRVIAVGGQTVMCCDPGGRVTVNGVPLDESYVFLSSPNSPPQQFGPVTVPQGRLWVMGDHRDGSADSRAHIDDGTDGTVPVSDVIGKAFVIVWPPSRWNTLGTPGTFHSLSSGPLSVGAPMALGVIGTLPVAGLRRRRRRRRRAAGG